MARAKTVAEEPSEDLAVPSDTEEVPAEEAPVEDAPVEEEFVPLPEGEPEVVPEVDPAAVLAEPTEVGGVEIGLNPGEEVISQRARDDAVVVAVTNFGRKLEITPEGEVTVVTGAPLDVVMPAEPIRPAVTPPGAAE
jgi:hypothetical protein